MVKNFAEFFQSQISAQQIQCFFFVEFYAKQNIFAKNAEFSWNNFLFWLNPLM